MGMLAIAAGKHQNYRDLLIVSKSPALGFGAGVVMGSDEPGAVAQPLSKPRPTR